MSIIDNDLRNECKIKFFCLELFFVMWGNLSHILFFFNIPQPIFMRVFVFFKENMTPSDVPKSDRLLGDLVGQHDAALNSIDSNNSCQSSGNIKANTKGIRNRVFCGECKGCLKNEDCGICRYCIDKTKFGGLNRLRQKCVHRRCEVGCKKRFN